MRAFFATAILLTTNVALAAPRTTSGVVVTSANDPVPDAVITLFDDKGQIVGTAKSDKEGVWKTSVERKGTLTVRVEVTGIPPTTTPLRDDQVAVRTEIKSNQSGGTDLEVTGDKPPPPPPPSTPTRYTLESTLLTKLPGTRGDAFAAVTSLPSMGRPPALSTVYIVRGAGPEETGTYVDGAPMPHAFHFGGLVAVIPSNFVRSISIAPGGFGPQFGRATAGIVDVLLATPPADSVHGTIGLDAIDVSAALTAPLIKGNRETTVSIGARRSHVDAWIGSLLGDAVAGDLPRSLDGQIIIEHAFSSRSRVRAGFVGAADVVSVSDPNAPADRPRAGAWRSDLLRIHARYDGNFASKGTVLAVVSAGRSRDSITGETDYWETVRNNGYARLEGTIPLDGPERAPLTIGSDVLLTHLVGQRVLGIPSSSFGGSSVFALRGTIVVERVEPGAYAQLQIEPIKGVTVTPGIRFDRAPRGEPLWQPRLSIRAEVAQTTALKAVAGLYARSNPFDAVDARDYNGTLIPVVVDAGPVRGAHGGIGIEQGFARDIFLLIDVWGRATNGVLVPVQQPAKPIYEDLLAGGKQLIGYEYPLHTDQARTRAAGIEALFKYAGPSFAGFIGYALTRAEVRDTQFTAWRRAPFDQTHVFNTALLVRLGNGWEAGGRFRLAVGVLDSPYPATEIAPRNDPSVDPSRPLPQLQPIHSLDVRLEKSWKIASGSFAAYLEIRNVYDRRAREPLAYNHVYGYPVVGNGLPIIPNIGVRGAF